jgi:transposase InsO family protein
MVIDYHPGLSCTAIDACRVLKNGLKAYVEAFHAILERECYSRHEFESFMDAFREITWYVDYYNRGRKHGSLGYMAP